MNGHEHSAVALAYTGHWQLGSGERAVLLGLAIVQDVELRSWVRPTTIARHLAMTPGNAADMMNRPRLRDIIEIKKVPFRDGKRYTAYRVRTGWTPPTTKEE